jgi:tripartite-type tricarboxylate transporter receptor subunit TctC
MFKRMTGTELVAVGYRGSGPALNDLVAGNLDLMFDNITAAIKLVRSARIRGLAVTSAQRTSLAPEYPTVAETVADFDVSTFFGVVVRASTPAHVVARIERDVVAVASEPAVKERLAAVVAEAVGSSSAEFGESLGQERTRWAKVIKDLGIRIE